MSIGDITGLIAAGAFAVLVGFMAMPLIKLAKVFDQTKESIKETTEEITPILEEVTLTLRETNKQMSRFDTITSDVADVTGNISALVALFAASLGGPLIKVAQFSGAVRAALSFRWIKHSPENKK